MAHWKKKDNKLDKPIHEIAGVFAARFIGQYGIKAAEVIARLVLEKIIASRRSLERKYGKK